MEETVAVEKFGIENIKPLVALGIEFGNVADKFGRAKGLKRYLTLIDLVDELLALPSVKFSLIDDELKDLSPEERKELELFVAQKFDIVDEKLELAIESGLGLVKKAFDLIEESIDLVKSLKPSEVQA